MGSFDLRIPFVDHLGVELLEKADGRVRIAFAPRPEHFNSWNGIHGGVVMSLPPVYREALLLTEYEGMSQVEMAKHLSLGISAAKSRVVATTRSEGGSARGCVSA